jgi:hypothetical protein
MGGAKTKMGTLDTQDLLLRGLESSEEDRLFSNHAPGSRGGGPMDEKERALDLCKLCQVWGLQGVIRMEAGFEIIKCDFSESLEQIQVLQRPDPSTREGHREALGNFEYMRGVAARYQGIGSSRTVIDYSSMVSAFFFPINLTNTDPSRPDLPRLSSTSAAELVAIKSYLDAVVGERKDQAIRTIDWQDISDLIVGRYADRIQYMAQKVTSVDIMVAEVNFLLDLYIDYSEKPQPDLSAAIQRCTNFYLQSIVPLTESDHLLQAAFTSVSSKICTSLFEIRQLVQGDQAGEESPLEASVRAAADLMHVLGWSRFKQCSGCDVDMVCLIPMWPFGSVDNYYNPHCTNGSDAHHGGSYWEGPGRGNGPPPRMTERWTPWAPWL